jgi:hypothetical protein
MVRAGGAGGAVFLYGWIGRKRDFEEKGEHEALISDSLLSFNSQEQRLA